MKAWFLKWWASTKAYCAAFWNEIKAMPLQIVKMVNVFISGISAQLSTAKGATVGLVVIVALYDVWKKGSAGVIQFSINTIVKFIDDLFKIITQVGVVQLVVVVLLIVFYLDYRKVKK